MQLFALGLLLSRSTKFAKTGDWRATLDWYLTQANSLNPLEAIAATLLEAYERQETAQRLRDAVHRLPLKYRMIVELFDLNEKSLSDTQMALRISTSAAKTGCSGHDIASA